jgi:hypothetical protein
MRASVSSSNLVMPPPEERPVIISKTPKMRNKGMLFLIPYAISLFNCAGCTDVKVHIPVILNTEISLIIIGIILPILDTIETVCRTRLY